MSLYRDEAIVLRTHKLGEADRIITLLTRDHGKVRAVAKGVRRTKSKFGSRLEPFTHVDVQCYVGRSLDVVTQAESLHAYGAELVADYSRYTAGQLMLETAERMVPEEREPTVSQYLLLVGGLRALVAGEHDADLVLDAYLLRSCALGGYAPSFDDCVHCGTPGPHRFFHVPSGGSLCVDDRVPGSATPRPETLTLLAALLSGDWDVADESTATSRREGNGIVAAYLQWHLERGLRSLPFVERGRSPARSAVPAHEAETMTPCVDVHE